MQTRLPPIHVLERHHHRDTFPKNLAAPVPYTQHLNVLGEYLDVRPTVNDQNKIIAVDGVDQHAVYLLIATLQHHITNDLGCAVRVFGADLGVPAPLIPDLLVFMTKIQHWGEMWAQIAVAPPVQSSSGTASRDGPGALPTPPPPSRPCVYIMPLSPLMATLKAADRVSYPSIYNPNEHFRWLASHWDGYIRPDITVNVQDCYGAIKFPEVLRLQAQNMNTLVVTKGDAGNVSLTPKQLRRVTFEVEEWLQDD